MAGFFSKGSRAEKIADGESSVVPISQHDFARRVELLDSFENSGLGWFWATDALGRIIYFSQNAKDRLGLSDGDIIGKPLTDILQSDDADQMGEDSDGERPLAYYLGARNSITKLPVRFVAGDQDFYMEIAGKPQFDAKNRFCGYRGSAKDITSTRQTQRDAKKLAQFDALTGLANRHRMNKRLESMLHQYRAAKRVCALMMLDLDRFKQVNDTLGHPAGDELLKQVAARLGQIFGEKAEIGRLGGDEFLIMLPDIDDRGELGDFASRIIQMVAQPYSINGSRAIIGVSVGVAIAPYDGLDAEELVKAADLALYAAKGGGRGQYRFYSRELQEGAKMRRQLEEDLRDALVKDELVMHYQPIVKTSDYKLSGFEALIRWEHPDRGLVSPEIFISCAEDIGMIADIGEWALYRVCEEAAEWPVELRVAVNVSPTQFTSSDFIQVVQRALQKSGLDPDRLELEITESVFAGDDELTREIFKSLKDLGVRLALDDFGTGYSSLAYLRRFPFDRIKIDRGFVTDVVNDAGSQAIVSTITGLARALGMETTAEGIEDARQLDALRKLGVNEAQGYLIARPVPPECLFDPDARPGQDAVRLADDFSPYRETRSVAGTRSGSDGHS